MKPGTNSIKSTYLNIQTLPLRLYSTYNFSNISILIGSLLSHKHTRSSREIWNHPLCCDTSYQRVQANRICRSRGKSNISTLRGEQKKYMAAHGGQGFISVHIKLVCFIKNGIQAALHSRVQDNRTSKCRSYFYISVYGQTGNNFLWFTVWETNRTCVVATVEISCPITPGQQSLLTIILHTWCKQISWTKDSSARLWKALCVSK